MSDLRGQSVRELAGAVRHGTVSSLELVETELERIEATAELNAFIPVVANSARERARQADQAASCDDVTVEGDNNWIDAVEQRIVGQSRLDECRSRSDFLDSATEGRADYLMAETDAESRNLPIDEFADEVFLFGYP